MRIGILAGVAVAAVVGGCAGVPDCSRSIERAGAAAEAHEPLDAWIEGIDASCRAEAEAEWTEALAADCAPLYAFHAARTGLESPERCTAATFDNAWNLGGMIGEMERRRAEIESRLASGDIGEDEARRLRRELITIGRDLPQVEALARMDGLLPAAEVPESAGD